MENDPLEQLHKLRDAADRAAMNVGLKRIEFAVIPGEDGRPDIVMATFKIDPSVLMSIQELEQSEYDSSFDDLIKNFDGPPPDPRKEKMDKMKEELEKELNNDDGW